MEETVCVNQERQATEELVSSLRELELNHLSEQAWDQAHHQPAAAHGTNNKAKVNKAQPTSQLQTMLVCLLLMLELSWAVQEVW